MNFRVVLILVIIGIICTVSLVVAFDGNNRESNDYGENNPSEISVPFHHSFNSLHNTNNNTTKNNFTIDSFLLNQ